MKHFSLKIMTLILALSMLLPMVLIGCGKTETPPVGSDAATGSDTVSVTPAAGVVLDLTEEWEAIYGENTLVQGCLVINTAFAAAHPNEVARFLQDYSASVNKIRVGDDAAVNTVVEAGILPKAAVAKKALPGCNLCYIAGADAKPVMNTFSEKIFSYDASSIGGALPTDAFYYTASGNPDQADKSLPIKVYALNGTTALGMAQMIVDQKNGASDMGYDISLHTAADAITGAIVSGECAIAALPTNVAVKLFNKSQGKLQLLALNTLGVLYLLENGDQGVSSLADLKGKTVYLPGAGSNPEYITAALLVAAGLKVGEDVILDTTTYNSPDALQAAFVAGKAPLAVLPEPKVTVALTAANTQK